MATFKCKMCGGALEIEDGSTVATCDYCGTKQTISKSRDEIIANLFNRANNLRLKCEFDKAAQIYEKIVEQDDSEAEAHWGIVLCKYGIEYVEDPKTKKRIPTCHRTLFEAVTTDADYIAAVDYSDAAQQSIYESEARAIDKIQKDILSIVKNEKPFDVFICYKETDDNGKRTIDSAIANDIYYQLTQEGFKVFFAAITLEDKLGQEYEPYIFAALNSSKVMLVLGTKPEYFNAVWVKNEWSRFLQLMKTNRSKLLIPCYRDMDAYDLPEEFAHLQAQDMSKIGFINDVVRGIKKIVESNTPKKVVRETVTVADAVSGNIAALIKRGFMALEDGEWAKADEFFEQVLNQNAELAEAYLGKLMAELNVRKQEQLAELTTPFDNNSYYEKVIRYADIDLKNTIQGYINTINERINEKAYLEAIRVMNFAKSEDDYTNAAEKFDAISEYSNSAELADKCRECAKGVRDEAIYQVASIAETAAKKQKLSRKVFTLKRAISKYEEIPEYKDSADKISKLKLDIEETNKKILETKKKTKKITIIVAITMAVVALLSWLFVLTLLPLIKYNIADNCVKNKEYQRAVAIYTELEDYKDSKANLQKSTYLYAKELMADKKYQEAITLLNSIGDYEKSVTLKNQCYSEGIQIFLANKDYSGAIAWWEEAENYDKNNGAYRDACYNYATEKYNSAVQKSNTADLLEAITYFEKSGNYKDAKEQTKIAKYEYIKLANNTTSYEYLKELKTIGYKDSANIYKERTAWKAYIDVRGRLISVSDLLDNNQHNAYAYVNRELNFNVYLSGGEPDTTTTIKVEIIESNGSKSTPALAKQGTSGMIWSTDYTPTQVGTLKLKVYDGNNNVIGECSVKVQRNYYDEVQKEINNGGI